MFFFNIYARRLHLIGSTWNWILLRTNLFLKMRKRTKKTKEFVVRLFLRTFLKLFNNYFVLLIHQGSNLLILIYANHKLFGFQKGLYNPEIILCVFDYYTTVYSTYFIHNLHGITRKEKFDEIFDLPKYFTLTFTHERLLNFTWK